MEVTPLSLVQQIHQANELWQILLWVGGALSAVCLWFIRQIWIKQSRIEEKMDQLERDVIKDFVTYTVFNTVVKDLKDEIHNSMREVRAELSNINVFLRKNQEKL